jgi:hypothetical protein
LREICASVAGIDMGIRCADDGLAHFFESELDAFLCDRAGRIIFLLEIDWAPAPFAGDIQPGDYKFRFPGGLELQIDEEKRSPEYLLRIRAYTGDATGGDGKEFLYAFILGYVINLALQRQDSGGGVHYVMIHACGVIYGGRAFLFAGASGVGKSTVAEMMLAEADTQLLGDDMIIITRAAEGWQAHGSPLGGAISRNRLSNSSCRLEAIYLLSQGDRTGWRRLETAQAASALMSAIVPVVPLKYTANQRLSDYDRESLDRLMGDASLVAAEIPCFALDLSLEDTPWERLFAIKAEG